MTRVLPVLLTLAVLAAAPAFAAPTGGKDTPKDTVNDGGAPPAALSGQWSHAYASYGEPKYPRGFRNFDYVNPDAPKGGRMQLSQPDRRTSFDKFNYFTIKGNAPAGIKTLMMEALVVRSGDEPGTIYGRLAQDIMVAPDKSWEAFRLHPKARFSNGDPVTAAENVRAR